VILQNRCLYSDGVSPTILRNTRRKPVALLKRGTLKSYPGLPHGMPTTHAEQINADLLEFTKAG
jgi:hypothetical protein